MIKKIIALSLTAIMAVTFVACKSDKDAQEETTTTTTTTTTTAPPVVTNPFTGEEGYSKSAVGVRPVAIVVENHKQARPQWGITSPDIIVEGEVEGGITRMLWLYADYNDVPSQVGPIRSARPSFVKFSTFFDAVFIHWGGSHSKSSYTGGYETITKLGVDNIDGMSGGTLFGRDKSRGVSSEHTGIVKGANLKAAIDKKGYDMKVDTDSFTTFDFYDESTAVGTSVANSVSVKFSSRTDTRKFTYDSTDKLYRTNDWETSVSFKNLIILMDSTTYITTPYKSSSTTYLNYTLNSGKGYLVSNGTQIGINWSTASGKLELTDANGNAVKLNVGDSYIGLASSNNKGSVTFA